MLRVGLTNKDHNGYGICISGGMWDRVLHQTPRKRHFSREPTGYHEKMTLDLFSSILEGINRATTENLREEDILYKQEPTSNSHSCTKWKALSWAVVSSPLQEFKQRWGATCVIITKGFQTGKLHSNMPFLKSLQSLVFFTSCHNNLRATTVSNIPKHFIHKLTE